MTPSEIDSIATATAQKAVRSTFLLLGVNIENADDIEKVQADFKHLRAWRESTEAVKRKALLTAVTVLVTGFLGYLALAFKGS